MRCYECNNFGTKEGKSFTKAENGTQKTILHEYQEITDIYESLMES